MYLRAVHAEFDIPALRNFIRNNPLGIFITSLQSSNFPTIQCTHIPWILDVDDEDSETELGQLRGHLARANPHCKALVEAINGPVHSYVTPKFYTETKPNTGKVVPTWNYSAVQVYGKAKIFFDSQNQGTGLFLQKQINDLTKHSEETIMDHTGGETLPAWEVSDAPPRFIELLQKSIVGIQINIDRLEGKFKMNQELGKGDRQGVVEGFDSLGTEEGHKMARTVEERGALKDSKGSVSSPT